MCVMLRAVVLPKRQSICIRHSILSRTMTTPSQDRELGAFLNNSFLFSVPSYSFISGHFRLRFMRHKPNSPYRNTNDRHLNGKGISPTDLNSANNNRSLRTPHQIKNLDNHITFRAGRRGPIYPRHPIRRPALDRPSLGIEQVVSVAARISVALPLSLVQAQRH